MTVPNPAYVTLRTAANRVRRTEFDLELARAPGQFGVTSPDWIRQCERVSQDRRREQACVVRLAAEVVAEARKVKDGDAVRYEPAAV